MKDLVEVEIDMPQRELAELYADPRYAPQWMHDVDRLEPVRGEPGAVGSQYRLIPKQGSMVFLATVLERSLPTMARLLLESTTVDVEVRGKLVALSPTQTRLSSEEVFTFKGLLGPVMGVLARPAIRKAHRRHMEDFKRYAEQR